MVLLVDGLILRAACVRSGGSFICMSISVLLELGVDLCSLHVVRKVHETVDLLCVLSVVSLLLPIVVRIDV